MFHLFVFILIPFFYDDRITFIFAVSSSLALPILLLYFRQQRREKYISLKFTFFWASRRALSTGFMGLLNLANGLTQQISSD